jgi:hypothetical protein
MNRLLPDNSPNALESWISYANRLESNGNQPASQLLTELAAEFTLANQRYGEETATQAFNIALECCYPPTEVNGAANHLHHGVDANNVVTLAIYGKLNDPPVGRVDIKTEAERIIAELAGLTDPNSPNKTHFMVKISHEFLYLASTKDQERLFNALPYKTRTIGNMKGEKGLFVTVTNDEILKQRGKAKSSILGQLADAQKEAAAQARPDKSATKKAAREEL